MIFASVCPTLGTEVKLLFLGLVNPPLTSLLPRDEGSFTKGWEFGVGEG